MRYRAIIRVRIQVISEPVGLAAICSLTDEAIEWVQSGFISNFEYIKWWERYIFHYATHTAGDYTSTEDAVVTYL